MNLLLSVELMCHNQFWLKKTPKVIRIFPKMIFYENLWNSNCSWELWRLVKNPKSNTNTRYKSKFWCPGHHNKHHELNVLNKTLWVQYIKRHQLLYSKLFILERCKVSNFGYNCNSYILNLWMTNFCTLIIQECICTRGVKCV